MEALGMMISAAVSGGLLSDFFVGTWVDISHIADDTLLFVCFEAMSGLKTKLAKSELVPIENVDRVAGLSGILGCGVVGLCCCL
jgi:hypothetical protein